jgi:predicted nuclease of predicted toxin-antitoxin system
MRLLLDANLSGRRIGGPLRERGHDVLALAEHLESEGLDDPDVLALAAAERRVLITRNSRDFAPLVREWAEAKRAHAGCILIWTLEHHELGAIVRQVERLLEERPHHADWLDLVIAV